MWVKFIEQDWYLEEPEFFEEELKEVCKNLECNPEDIWIIHTDEDMELIKEITQDFKTCYPPLDYKGQKIYSIYSEGGLLSLFSKVDLN